MLVLERDGLDMARTLAWMIFPKSEIHRKQHLARTIAWAACEDTNSNGEIVLSAAAMKEILVGPGKVEMEEMAAEAAKRGTVAGDLLTLIYKMNAGGHSEPSFGKAIEQYKSFALGLKYGDGESLKYSEETLRTYFKDYASVSHLWAAFRFNQGPYFFAKDPRDVFRTDKAFVDFLGVAKSIAQFASTFIPKRTKPPKPIVSLEVFLQIPEEIPAMNLVLK